GLTPDNGNEWMAAGRCRRVSWLRRWTEKRPLTNFTPININFVEAGSVGPVVMLGPVAKSFQYLLTDPRQFDILQSGPSWRGANAIRSIETARIHHAARRRGGNHGCQTDQHVRKREMLELYHSINSVCAQKVRLALTEKELEAKEHLMTLR